MRLLLPLLSALALLPAHLSAQAFEDPGPHPAGWRQITFVSPPTLPGRVYYPALAPGQDAPADPGAGYPLVGLIHGQSFEPADYDALSLHIASWGYVVCSIGPLAGGLHAPPTASKKMRDMLHWMVAESATPTSPFAGLANDAPWSVLGHSLGGQAVIYVPYDEPKVTTIIALEPYYDGSSPLVAKLNGFAGATLAIGGEMDGVVPPALNAIPLYQDASPLGRSLFVEIKGSGHYGSLDVPPSPLPDTTPLSEQHRMHRKIITAFLEAQAKGDEDAYVALLGEGAAGELFAPECSCDEPMLWAPPSTASPGVLALGLGGRALEPAWLAMSPYAASIPTRAGTIGLAPGSVAMVFSGLLDADGRFELPYPLPPLSPGRTIHLQGAVQHADGLVVTRTAVYLAP